MKKFCEGTAIIHPMNGMGLWPVSLSSQHEETPHFHLHAWLWKQQKLPGHLMHSSIAEARKENTMMVIEQNEMTTVYFRPLMMTEILLSHSVV